MKKIQDSIVRSLPPLRLYEDEIREVCSFLAEDCKYPCKITTCGYELNSPDELSSLPVGSTNSIEIKCYPPYISIDLGPTSGRVYLSEGSVLSEGIASRIESILLKGKVWIPAFRGVVWYLSGFLFSLGFAYGILWKNMYLAVIAGAAILISMIWQVLVGIERMYHFNTIIFRRRKESLGFWQRNKDEIGVTLIKVILAAALGFVSGWYLKG